MHVLFHPTQRGQRAYHIQWAHTFQPYPSLNTSANAKLLAVWPDGKDRRLLPSDLSRPTPNLMGSTTTCT